MNSAGFLLLGTFTSHVTGNVGRFASDLAEHRLAAATLAAVMVAAFFVGAFLSSVAIESSFFASVPRAYAVALGGEAALISAFVVVSRFSGTDQPRALDAEAMFLCAAMGMQNSLVTRLSGAVIRTTHLTGTITDIGIEVGRWFRWWRTSFASRIHVRLAMGAAPTQRPSPAKIALLSTIFGAFTGGAALGATLAVSFREAAMFVPIAAVLCCAAYAYRNGASDKPTSLTPRA